MHALLSAAAGQEQHLTELLVTYAKVSLLGPGSDPCAKLSASSWGRLAGNARCWNKMVKKLLYLWQRCLAGVLPVLLFKIIKGQAVVFP